MVTPFFRRAFAALFASALVVTSAWAQLTVTGTVVDEVGAPLPGVNVLVVGTTQGTTTDLDGEYELIVLSPGEETVLEARFVGFQPARESTVQRSGTAEIDFELEPDIIGISEVVVTGASGLTEKRQLGNSISTVGGEEIASSGAPDVTGALAGKIAGAQVSQTSGSPAGAISVKLRGNSTINSGAEPLYIIDGVIVDNSSNELVPVGNGGLQNRLVDINPNDIERIEVIKGAAAAAIYGSRASNGVVQIFTKKGRSGAPRITYSTTLQASAIRETVRVNDAPFDWVDPTDNSNLEKVPVERFDYQDDIFTEGLGTDQYLSVSGGSGNTNYFVSGSYYFNEGIVLNSDFNRATLRVNVGQALADWAFLDVGTNITRSFSNDVPTGGGSFFDGAVTSIQFLPGTVDPEPNDLGEYPDLGNAFFGNPLEIAEQYRFTQEVNRLTGNVNLALTPLEGLSANVILGYDNYAQEARGFKPLGTVADPNGFVRRGDLSRKLLNTDLNVQYQRPVTDALTSTTSVGGTYQYDRTESIINEADNLGPIVETVDGGTITASSDLISVRSIWGAFAQQTLAFQDRLFVTVAGRVDGSSVFGENERTQFYPKVSASWVVSDAAFWEDAFGGSFDLFKLRASWGQAGNLTGIGPFQRFTNYNPISFNGQTGLVLSSSLGNPDIRPERQTEIEVGADLAFFESRLGLEFTYYSQVIEDLLLPRVLAPSTGATTRIENAGELTNKGFELRLVGNAVQTRDLSLQVTALFSRNQNEVTDLNGPAFGIGNFSGQYAIEGQPLGVFYWRAYARNEDGSLLLAPDGLPQAERGEQDVNDPFGQTVLRDEDGQPTGTLLRFVLGDPEPDWTGSLITDLTYKKWAFRMQWDAVQGFDVFNWNRRNFDRHNYRGGYEYGLELREGSTIPKGTANAKGSGLIAEEYVEDGSFIKLREVSVGYTLTPPVAWLSSVELRLSGRNLLSIDDYSGYDPEVSIDGRNTGVVGFDFGAVPIPRTYSFGATLTF